jgi:hypothetical protein
MQVFFRALALLCTVLTFSVHAEEKIQKKSILKEGKNYKVEISYPAGLGEKIDEPLEQMIQLRLKNFLKYASIKDKLPPDVTSKNTLFINYHVPYHTLKVTSILFDVSIYDRGAAHPRNSNTSFNFIDGNLANLKDLFISDSNFLVLFSEVSREDLVKKDLPDLEWVQKGTAPIHDNYKVWYFTPLGISLVFGNYQVAPYVFGNQVVDISKEKMNKILKPELEKEIWG